MNRPQDGLSLAPGAVKMMNLERLHASEATQTGIYCTFRLMPSSSSSRPLPDFCARVGSKSRCFCGLMYSQHDAQNRSLPNCKLFEFVPSRPEEVGDDFLPRRRGFNVETWRPKCKCGHSHDRHSNAHKRCSDCRCSLFSSDFLCVVCSKHWEAHSTVWESEAERREDGRSVRDAFIPLADIPGLQTAVFGRAPGGGGDMARGGAKAVTGPASRAGGGATLSPEDLMNGGAITVQEYMRLISLEDKAAGGGGPMPSGETQLEVGMRVLSSAKAPASMAPKQDFTKVDRSIALSHATSGGLRTGKVLNRYGKAELK